jgi:hypothetical protein
MTIIEEWLKAVFSLGSALRLYNEDPRPAEFIDYQSVYCRCSIRYVT